MTQYLPKESWQELTQAEKLELVKEFHKIDNSFNWYSAIRDIGLLDEVYQGVTLGLLLEYLSGVWQVIENNKPNFEYNIATKYGHFKGKVLINLLGEIVKCKLRNKDQSSG